MILIRIALYLLGAFACMVGLTGIMVGDMALGIIFIIVGAAIIIAGTKCRKKNVKAENKAASENARSEKLKIAETIRTKVVGVTFDNEDGENRQDILEQMTGAEEITVQKYKYNGEPAAYVKWGNKIIGNLSAELAKSLERKYPGARYMANILEISGGGVQTLGCNIELDVVVADKAEAVKRETIVYIESNSKKYHINPQCSGMKKPRAIPLSEAKKKYTACKKCCKY